MPFEKPLPPPGVYRCVINSTREIVSKRGKVVMLFDVTSLASQTAKYAAQRIEHNFVVPLVLVEDTGLIKERNIQFLMERYAWDGIDHADILGVKLQGLKIKCGVTEECGKLRCHPILGDVEEMALPGQTVIAAAKLINEIVTNNPDDDGRSRTRIQWIKDIEESRRQAVAPTGSGLRKRPSLARYSRRRGR